MQDLIKEVRYHNGDLYWSGQGFTKPIGCINSKGYKVFGFKGKQYYTHMVIFFIVNGYLPAQVDHKDNNPLNNFDWNLRASTVSQNQFNSKISSRNKSGVKGVSWDKRTNRWHVSICAGGKRHFGGQYFLIEDAEKSANSLRKRLHGDYANTGKI